jgi:hypothetical protein
MSRLSERTAELHRHLKQSWTRRCSTISHMPRRTRWGASELLGAFAEHQAVSLDATEPVLSSN